MGWWITDTYLGFNFSGKNTLTMWFHYDKCDEFASKQSGGQTEDKPNDCLHRPILHCELYGDACYALINDKYKIFVRLKLYQTFSMDGWIMVVLLNLLGSAAEILVPLLTGSQKFSYWYACLVSAIIYIYIT